MFEPNEPGGGYDFESEGRRRHVPKEYVPGVEKGLRAPRKTACWPGSR